MEYILGVFGGFFSGLFSTGDPLFLIVVKNATIDIKTFRATMFGVLGLVSVIRVPLIAYSGILKLNEALIKNCVLVALLLSGLMLTFKS